MMIAWTNCSYLAIPKAMEFQHLMKQLLTIEIFNAFFTFELVRGADLE